VTQQAISIPVLLGALEAEPRLSSTAYERMREVNRGRVSLPKIIGNGDITRAKGGVASDEAGQEVANDPTKPSEEW
jgi:hypothetical protein